MLARVLKLEGVLHLGRLQNAPPGNFLQALLDQAQALLELRQPHQVAVEIVAPRADRNLEIKPVVDQVRPRPPHVVRHARGAQKRPGDPVGQGVFLGDDSGAFDPVHENPILGEEGVGVPDRLADHGEGFAHARGEIGRQVGFDPADSSVGGGDPGARQAVDELVELLPGLDEV